MFQERHLLCYLKSFILIRSSLWRAAITAPTLELSGANYTNKWDPTECYPPKSLEREEVLKLVVLEEEYFKQGKRE